MKRGGPIARRTPLRTKPPTGPKARTSPPPRPKARKASKGLKRARMDPALRESIYVRAGGLCDLHGGHIHPDAWECHHRQLRTRGGQDSHENLVALCPGCHAWVHQNPREATAIGFMVPRRSPDPESSYGDPAATPIFRHRRAWQQPVGVQWFTVQHGIEGANE